MDIKEKIARMKLHSFREIDANYFTAPHGQRYTKEYIETRTHEEFCKMLQQEKI